MVTLLLNERVKGLLALTTLNWMALKVDVLTESPQIVVIWIFWVKEERGLKPFLSPEMMMEPAQLDPPQILIAICCSELGLEVVL